MHSVLLLLAIVGLGDALIIPEHLAFPPTPALENAPYDSTTYMVPMRDGVKLVGSTVELLSFQSLIVTLLQQVLSSSIEHHRVRAGKCQRHEFRHRVTPHPLRCSQCFQYRFVYSQ